jgi:hypothetical protein
MIQKQAIPINFAQGLDTKTDPKQVQLGKFLNLQNSIFQKGGLLQKRNGYQQLTALPDSTYTDVTTFNGDLTAIGTSLAAYSAGSSSWINKGAIQPCALNVLPLVRNNLNQTQGDSAVSSNGLVCTVYTESNSGTLSYKYVIADSATGQNIVAPTVISGANATYGTPRVFILGAYFIVLYTNLVSSNYGIQYLAISTTNPSNVLGANNITTSYTPSTHVAFDAVLFNNSLYIAWNGASSNGIKIASLSSNLVTSASVILDASHVATVISICADTINNTLWASYYNGATSTGYVAAFNPSLQSVLSATQIISIGTVLNLASSAQNGMVTVQYELSNNYSYASSIPSHYINQITCTQGGTVGSATTVLRSVGLASKAFVINSTIYFLVAYQSPYQPTYFLVNSLGNIVAKLAYSNGGGYVTTALPSVTATGQEAQFAYLYKDFISSLSTQNNSQQTTTGGIYSQTGINLASITLGQGLVTSEIGSNLNISGGFLWGYDGASPVENNFFVWPDSVNVTTSTSGGSIAAQQYYYQAVYSWSDNQGNAFRSAPSIPVTITTTGSTSTNTINIPTLRLSYKTNVKIELYRWSAANQTYYQVTSVSSPTLNDPTTDSIAITDTLADSSIVGNNIIYTTGGVIENINPPATNITTLFDDRLWLVDAEDSNLLWFSKQVIEATPIEMSDLLTVYVAPTIASQGSTGPITALSAMDDKLIIFKENAIYYINGTGPDNTGANSQYAQPIFITATVGCANPQSVVFIPSGLMFQSDKGIWLLGRDLSTSYIGAPVEAYNSATVQSSVSIPGTNQVRFTLSSGITLMYDYYYQQWGTFTNVPAISSTLFQGLHTYINSYGQVYQESVGSYVDGSSPVLMGFTTSWVNIAGVQGYERAYHFFLLGQYISPHKLNLGIAYDYNSNPVQQTLVAPINYSPNYGVDVNYGSSDPYGGPGSLEQWRIFLSKQKCQAFQISMQEIYDSSKGVPAGAGLTLSGLNLIVGIKRGSRPIAAKLSAGSA